MWYSLAADGVVLIHCAFILFVALGGLLVFRWNRIAWLHIPATVWGALIEFEGWICPLTPLENSLRLAATRQNYSHGFIEYYLIPLIYPPGLTQGIQLFLGVMVVTVNLLIYAILVTRITRKRSKNA